MTNEFYTYVHRRNDTGQVFYVGKGKGRRAYDIHKRSEHWKRIAAKHGRTIEISSYWNCEADALAQECVRIAHYREIGVEIINKTNGGEGSSGYVPTEETRAKLRAAGTGRILSIETRNRQSAASIGRPKSQIAVDKVRLANLGKRASEETRKKISLRGTGRKHTDESIEKMRMSRASQDVRAKMSAASKAALSYPEVIKKMLASRSVSTTYGKAQRKPVKCLDSGEIYHSAKDAAASIGLHASNITAVCKGRKITTGGMRFCYAWLQKIDPISSDVFKTQTLEMEK